MKRRNQIEISDPPDWKLENTKSASISDKYWDKFLAKTLFQIRALKQCNVIAVAWNSFNSKFYPINKLIWVNSTNYLIKTRSTTSVTPITLIATAIFTILFLFLYSLAIGTYYAWMSWKKIPKATDIYAPSFDSHFPSRTLQYFYFRIL